MSSENETDGTTQAVRKGKVQRACDVCRRKKIRCDGGRMPRNRCSNCIAFRFHCTYVEAAKKRGPPKGYVESLENRLKKLEKLLTNLGFDIDVARELDGSFEPQSWSQENMRMKRSVTTAAITTTTSTVASIATAETGMKDNRPPIAELFLSDDELNHHRNVSDRMKKLVIDPVQDRFFGQSSSAVLIQKAVDLKKKYIGGSDTTKNLPVIDDNSRDSSKQGKSTYSLPKSISLDNPRDTLNPGTSNYAFPEKDLMDSLVDLYFTQVNIFMPLLHRPTFEKFIAEEFHVKNDLFGANLLLVCAIGSLYSNDPRVFLEGTDRTHSSGWKWFTQVQIVTTSSVEPPTLYDLQRCALISQFMEASSAPQSCWTMSGIGIRLAQDVGAHRKKVYNRRLTVEDELWKRAFWVLLCQDRIASAGLGRPCAIQDEDFDVELPIECDDEYWDPPDPAQAFKQPPGKPSVIGYFNSLLKLSQVLAFTLRTIYSINTSKILLGFVGQQWEQHIVAELDSALNKWIDAVPDHLRWEPNRDHELFYDQSVSLYANYYHLQILIHRPFIPSSRNPSQLSFPSLAICINAARSCSHVVDVTKRKSQRPMPHLHMCVFAAGIVLLLSIWGGRRAGVFVDPTKEMMDVHKCMQVLKACENKWLSTGRTWDVLYGLAFIGNLQLPPLSLPSTNKRERDSDDPISMSSITTGPPPSTSTIVDGPRAIAGLRRVSLKDASAASARQLPQNLPMHQVHPTMNSVNSVEQYWRPVGRADIRPPNQRGLSTYVSNSANNEMPSIAFPINQMFDDRIAASFPNTFGAGFELDDWRNFFTNVSLNN